MDMMEDVPPQTSLKPHTKWWGGTNQRDNRPGTGRISSTTPPFRMGGRGSKQLSKAIEKSSLERDQAGATCNEPQWAFCLGKHPCFAKILSEYNPSESSKSVIIQPMFSNDQDPHLFTPWEGHLWMTKSDKIYLVKMKQEIGGWRLQLTRELQCLLEQYSTPPGSLLALPASLGSVRSSGDNWDLVSLESSDLDDCSSVNSSMIFPLLEKDAGKEKNAPLERKVVIPDSIPNCNFGTLKEMHQPCQTQNTSVVKNAKQNINESSDFCFQNYCSTSNTAFPNPNTTPKHIPEPHGGRLSTSMSGGRKVSPGCLIHYHSRSNGVRVHQHPTKGFCSGRQSPLNVLSNQRIVSSPISQQNDQLLSKQQYQSNNIVRGHPKSPSTLPVAPSYSITSRSRTHPGSSSPSLSTTLLASPLPFPSKRCDVVGDQLEIEKPSTKQFSSSSLQSPTVSIASSALSPCILPCPSSTGSSRSSCSEFLNRADGDGESEDNENEFCRFPINVSNIAVDRESLEIVGLDDVTPLSPTTTLESCSQQSSRFSSDNIMCNDIENLNCHNRGIAFNDVPALTSPSGDEVRRGNSSDKAIDASPCHEVQSVCISNDLDIRNDEKDETLTNTLSYDNMETSIENVNGQSHPPTSMLEQQISKKRHLPNLPRDNKKSRSSNKNSSRTNSKTATVPSNRPTRRAASSPAAHRDAIFGSWPSRTQAASRGTWKL